MKRVVITGIGVVSCLGNNQKEVYQSLLNSKSGITFSEEYKEYNLKSNIHGKPNIKLEDYVDRKFLRFKLFGHQSLFEVPLPVGNLGGVPDPVNGHFDFSFIFLKIVLLVFF